MTPHDIWKEMQHYRWPHYYGVDLTMDTISRLSLTVKHVLKSRRAKWVKPLWYGGSGKNMGRSGILINYTPADPPRQVLCADSGEGTTERLETYPVPQRHCPEHHLGLEKQVLWQHGTPERIEWDNSLVDIWAREYRIECGCIIFLNMHQPLEKLNSIMDYWQPYILNVMDGGTIRYWYLRVAKASWLVNAWGSTSPAGPSQSKPPHSVERDKVPMRDRIWGIY